MSGHDAFSALRNASFELRTVPTGNEGKAADALDRASALLATLVDAAAHVALWMDDTPKRAELRAAIDSVRGQARQTAYATLGRAESLIVELAEGYEFRGDEGDYTPSDHERALIVDFAHEILSTPEVVQALTAPSPDVVELIEAARGGRRQEYKTPTAVGQTGIHFSPAAARRLDAALAKFGRMTS